MADISNLKINERANVERPNLWVTTIENKIYIKFIKFILKSAKLRMDERFQKLLIFGIPIIFQIKKKI